MKIDPALLAVYHATNFLLFAPSKTITLKIDQVNPEFAQLMTENNATSFAYISACNPRSHRHPDDANQLRHHHFMTRLQNENVNFLEGLGQSPDGTWKEPSLLLWNMNRDQAVKWGNYLEQNAVLWGAADAIPHLVICDCAHN